MSLAHLRLQSEYSLLESTLKLKDIPHILKEKGYTAAALCDTEAMYASLPFFLEMKKAGLQSILGVSLFLCPPVQEKKRDKSLFPKITLLAETDEGLKNLHRLVSLAHIEYREKGLPDDVLLAHKEGVIFLTGDLFSDVGKLIQKGLEKEAKARLQWYLEHFGQDQIFVEVQQQGLFEEAELFRHYLKFQKEFSFSMVATQLSLYLNEEDKSAAEVLRLIRTGEKMTEDRLSASDFGKYHLFSAKEMEEAFAYYPELLENVEKIAKRCKAEYRLNELHLPQFKLPKSVAQMSTADFLEKFAFTGLKKRLPSLKEQELQPYEERLKQELQVLKNMGFVDYFLIVADFIAYAKKQGIPVGPGRGSGAASLVAYCTGITDIDPLEYGLIFERFLNEDRVSLPDFDIDICYERRQEVIDYVYKKYGSDKVCQVITFGTLAPRAALRDVARVLDYPLNLVNSVCKEVSPIPHTSLKKVLEENARLKNLYQTDAKVKKWIDLSLKVEGLPRHSSTHAAGLVISPLPLTELCPLAMNGDVVVTQFEKDYLETIGLIKFDFLGLRTLTVIEESKALISKDFGQNLDMYSISYADEKVFEKISRGETEGVFQLESRGMVQFLKQLKPSCLEDIIAGTSLFRPGPMEQIPRYVEARHHPEKIYYHHPLLEPILKSTYGCIVYQEQVMRIVRDLAGFSMAQSDIVRRAMSKKKADELAYYEKLFLYGGLDEKGQKVVGCLSRGVSEAIGRKIFEEVLSFAGYAFNKPHAAAYAHLIYQTAWLKTHYPVQFYTALLNTFLGNQTQAAHYVHTARTDGVALLPLDINLSGIVYQTEALEPADRPHRFGIRIGLGAVKYVSTSYLEHIETEKKQGGSFKSLEDFLRRSSRLSASHKQAESLAQAGALDGFDTNRASLLSQIQQFFEHYSTQKVASVHGQLSLFEAEKVNESSISVLPKKEKRENLLEALRQEKDLLGFYVTAHPLEEFGTLQKAIQQGKQSEQHSTVLGLVRSIKRIQTRKGESMAFVLLETETEELDMTFFPKTYAKYQHFLEKERVLLVYGSRMSYTSQQEGQEENKESFVAEGLYPLIHLEKEKVYPYPQVHFKVKAHQQLSDLKPLLHLLEKHRGAMPCFLDVERTGKKECLPCQYFIQCDFSLQNQQIFLPKTLKDALEKLQVEYTIEYF